MVTGLVELWNDNTRELIWRDGMVLYVDFDGDYSNLYVGSNCIELDTHTHTQLSACKN